MSITSLHYDSGTVWTRWNTLYTSTVATNTIDANTTWIIWNNDYTTTGTATMSTNTYTTSTWQSWNDGYYTNQPLIISGDELDFPTKQVRDQEDLVRQATMAEQIRVEQEAREKAEQRAKELLMSLLDEVQKAMFEKEKYFHVVGQSGKVYRIRKGRAGNLRLIEDNKEVEKYCVHPDEQVPDEDTMVAQLIMLKHRENELIGMSNRMRLAA